MKQAQTPATASPAGRNCPRCGAPLDGFAPDGLCGACLFEGGMETEPEDAIPGVSVTGVREFGGYELIEEVGRGGMGVIFKARQAGLNRVVAVKMMLGGPLAGEAERARFRAEAGTAAQLQHPGIVAIHEVGEHEGQPFFSMDFVEGQNLAQVVGNTPLPSARAARYLKAIAEAVHFAHQRGVLHRDLKPSNVLIDSNSEPRVTDFGLAKWLDGDASLTATGQMLGSPSFMPPEQAGGNREAVGPASDVYSLGAMLYFLLTARAPFVAETIPATLRLAAESDAVSPRLLNASVPRDLETICTKCLEKEVAHRYATAGELAEELGRVLRDEPIRARPAGPMEKLWRWSRRHRALAAMAVTLIVTLVAGTTLLTSALRQSQKSEKHALESLRDTLVSEARLQRASGRMGQRFGALETLQRAAAIRVDAQVRDEMAAALAQADVRLVKKWPVRHSLGLARIVFSPDLQLYAATLTNGFEVRSTRDQTLVRDFRRRAIGDLLGAAFSPDNNWVAALFGNGNLEVWNMQGTEAQFRFGHGGRLPALLDAFPSYPYVDFHPADGLMVVSKPGEGVWLYSLGGGRETRLIDSQDIVLSLRFDRTGQRLAVQKFESLEVWDVTAGKRKWSSALQPAGVGSAWSGDGTMIAVCAGADSELHVLDAESGKTIRRLSGHNVPPTLWDFHPTAPWLVSASEDQTVRWWDVRNGRQLLQTDGRGLALQFSKDGRQLAAATGISEVGLYEIAAEETFREWQRPWSGADFAENLCGSGDGRFLLASGFTNISVWDTETRTRVLNFPTKGPHARAFFGVNDKEIIYSSDSQTGTSRRTFSWRGNPPAELTALLGTEQEVTSSKTGFHILFGVANHGRSWLVRIGDGVEVWPEGVRSRGREIIATGHRNDAALSPDEHWAAAINYPGRNLVVWDATTAKRLKTFKGEYGNAWFTPDGQWLIGGSAAGYQFWKAATWEAGLALPADLTGLSAGLVSFARGGKLAAFLGAHNSFHVVELPGGREILQLHPPLPLKFTGAVMSEDGTCLWAVSSTHRMFEWDLAGLSRELNQRLGIETGIPRARSAETKLLPPPPTSLPDTTEVAATIHEQILRQNWNEALRLLDHHAEGLMRQTNHDGIERLFSKTLTPEVINQPECVSLLLRRADFFSRLERWPGAIADVRRVIELEPAKDQNYFTLALLLSRQGDRGGYEAQRLIVLERFASTTNATLARRISKVCLLTPAEGRELATACELARRLSAGETAWYELGMALAEYRNGNDPEALRWSATARVRGKPKELIAQSWLIAAMAHHRLNQSEPARAALSEGRRTLQSGLAAQRVRPWGGEWGWASDWGSWLVAEVQMLEAATLIEEK